MKKLLLFILFIILPINVNASVFYVRTDGGTTTECTGLADAAYDGEGEGEACAFSHPSWALGAGYDKDGTHASGVISSEDTLVIKSGSYQISYGMENATGCSASWTYQCELMPPPNGIEGSHTTVVGCSETGCTNPDDKPELWLAGRSNRMMELTDASYITFKDLEITDHYGSDTECSAGDPVEGCGRTAFGATNNWHDITFDGLNIHGLTSRCWLMGGSGAGSTNVNLRIIDTTCRAAGGAGFDGDTCTNDGTCGFEGDILFDGSSIEYAGCEEVYPLTGIGEDIVDASCREGNNGGYGDGIGMSDSGGDWVFRDTSISHNTSDGLDLLYVGRKDNAVYGASSVLIYSSLFEGNNGNNVKVPSGAKIYSSKIIGNCNYFEYGINDMTASGFSTCRAAGNPIIFALPTVYDAGTVSVENGSPTIEGTEDWSSLASAGDIIVIDTEYYYTISEITDGTTIVVSENVDRATGSGLSYRIAANAESYLYNNTIISVADAMIVASGNITAYNNIFRGGRDYRNDTYYFGGGEDQSIDLYYNGSEEYTHPTTPTITAGYNICYGDFKDAAANFCSDGTNSTADPKFSGTILQGPAPDPGYYWDSDYAAQINLQSDSPAIGAADKTAQTDYLLDYCEIARGTLWDIGALEYGSVPTEDSTGITFSNVTLSNVTIE